MQKAWFIGAVAVLAIGAGVLFMTERPLTVTVLLIVAIGVLLPFSPLAGDLGFAPLPVAYFPFLIGAIATYLLLVEVAKRRIMSRLLA